MIMLTIARIACIVYLSLYSISVRAYTLLVKNNTKNPRTIEIEITPFTQEIADDHITITEKEHATRKETISLAQDEEKSITQEGNADITIYVQNNKKNRVLAKPTSEQYNKNEKTGRLRSYEGEITPIEINDNDTWSFNPKKWKYSVAVRGIAPDSTNQSSVNTPKIEDLGEPIVVTPRLERD